MLKLQIYIFSKINNPLISTEAITDSQKNSLLICSTSRFEGRRNY